MAATYGWSARKVESELTDEQLTLYLDEAVDRLRDRAQHRFDAMIEAVRAGTIFAHDGKAHGNWLRKRKSPLARGLTGEALERAVSGFALVHPEYVVRGAR